MRLLLVFLLLFSVAYGQVLKMPYKAAVFYQHHGEANVMYYHKLKKHKNYYEFITYYTTHKFAYRISKDKIVYYNHLAK